MTWVGGIDPLDVNETPYKILEINYILIGENFAFFVNLASISLYDGGLHVLHVCMEWIGIFL